MIIINAKNWLKSGVLLLALLPSSAFADQEKKSIKDLDIDELLNQRVALHRESDTASGVNETLMDAPAAMVILTKEDISRRGYLTLEEIMSDLPGFDTITTNGTFPIASYQRGFRNDRTQRTLLLINGKVDNHLWNQSAIISKQYSVQAIERIEVLYGPAGAVYGPNAFLGVINIITRDPRTLSKNEDYFSAQMVVGDYNTHSIDFTGGGHLADANFIISGRLYDSDGPDIDDYADWGFNRPELLNDPDVWGKAIASSDFNNDGVIDKFAGNKLGIYGDTTIGESVIAELSLGKWKLGTTYWKLEEGYGPYYPFDKAQSNVSWFHDSNQYYLDHLSKVNKVEISSELLYRENNVYGYWAENSGGSVSLSNWNAYNYATRFRQHYNYHWNNDLQLSGGIKYERKKLTKAYRICGYWAGSLCPTAPGGVNDGSDIHSGDDRDTIALPDSYPRHEFDPQSKVVTRDQGLFFQAIYDVNDWRFNGGLRWDKNSIYGSMTSPRGAVIYHYSPTTTFKLAYGEAFQEPSARLLYGGWTGRAANPELKSEESKNLEFIAIHQTENFLHDISIFTAKYDNVIVNGGSGNLNGRDIWGIEYRGKVNINNIFSPSEDITAQLYYSYTDAQSDDQYFQGYNSDGSDAWVKKKDEAGDIAPHKVIAIVDIPFSENWTLNIQAHWLSKRTLFSQNPLRAKYNNNRPSSENRAAKSYFTVDTNLSYRTVDFEAGLRIDNLFGEDYLLPGVESANSGDDFSKPSAGFVNSLIPQANKPTLMAYFSLHY
ncbi:hypothetical protein tinsulaeT_25620 [Thalassotalea insulae]|uniref:Iron complex outermembrane receptor protein n=1 Tax=Thalassotalea insulae TaxID=2056778 RepID=A0ABQ6GV40_9GAMM|nr:TonB-dependent receptor [Thalassotalea insulae]GLX79222.1 hypothetical protein tinsulaeT_25620 [Thalassotalea insulae]